MTTRRFTIGLVCTANVCRSPFAEAALARRLRSAPWANTVSGGTDDTSVTVPPTDMLRAALAAGIDLSTHRPQVLSETTIDECDLILTMTREHRRRIALLRPRSARRSFTLREFARVVEHESTDPDVVSLSSVDDAADPLRDLAAAVGVVAARRGLVPRPSTPSELDILDPYGGRTEAYRRAVDALLRDTDTVARFLEGVVNSRR